MELEIYDCTLREGEQTAGVSFSVADRLKIAKMLDVVGVDYIELGWPVLKEAMKAFHAIKKLQLKVKVVAFGSTSLSRNAKEDKNLKSIVETGTKYACIFGKSWLEHVKKQLHISAEENLRKISDSIRFLEDNSLEVFYDAEHYFDAFKSNKYYALETLKTAAEAGASRIILCDTNGGIMYNEVASVIKDTIKEIGEKVKLGVHFHHDSGLSLTNSLEALPYVQQIQVTVNGIGERVGNTDLCELAPILKFKKKLNIKIKIEELKKLSDLVYEVSNLPHQIRQPFVRQRAFTHKGGVHIDATLKGASYEHVKPEALGMNHELILSSIGGAACVISAAKKFGYNLDKNNPKIRTKIIKLLEELSKIEKKGYDLGNLSAEQYLLIEKYFGDLKEYFIIKEWKVKTEKRSSECYIKISLNGKDSELIKQILGGPVDALYKTISEILSYSYPKVGYVKLVDYKVRIARQNGVESSVRTRIDFFDSERFSTAGVSKNIIESSLEALQKGFNYYLNRHK